MKKRKKSLSGFRGVKIRKDGKFTARIFVGKKERWLGSFDRIELAAIAYNEAALKHFGEFANLNEIS